MMFGVLLTTGVALAVGTPLPSLSGEYLTGEQARLPEDCRGKVALLVLGFTYESRYAVEAWAERFRDEFRNAPQVTFYEVPVIGGLSRLAKWWIDRGMRNGTPAELHRHVVTVYGRSGEWKEFVGYRDGTDAYLILVDAEGNVRWQHQGQFDDTRFRELAERARELLASAS